VAYTTRWCGYCIAARHLLNRRQIPYAEVDVGGNAEARRWLAETSGRTSVPQIFVRGRSIGGFFELLALDRGHGLGLVRSSAEEHDGDAGRKTERS
jgi:glutaredoxin 3